MFTKATLKGVVLTFTCKVKSTKCHLVNLQNGKSLLIVGDVQGAEVANKTPFYEVLKLADKMAKN